ncbi:sentrin-specific protease 8 [Anaeramoeba flamelloides]|uniref:Sentrin-specific protease n=1 Tax=Anaeramoeba flamelloides TaxID=1746091 RepID=A0AAV7Z906_9EUKA|nr:sentrin-specific protease [Anaeramoeba flamelloides]KAJ6233511.1 sentrin-specific protease 8 [Anaeramoeba flamelloides]
MSHLLIYKSVTLYKEDLLPLQVPQMWLTDNQISFYYEYLTETVVNKSGKKIFLMTPPILMLLSYTNSPQEIKEIFQANDLSKQEYIFLPINNKTDFDQFSGSHWSLLIFVKSLNTFFYYDSLYQSNFQIATQFAERLAPVLVPETIQKDKFGQEEKVFNTNFVEVLSPQQENGFDCGVFSLAFTKFFVENVCDTKTEINEHLFNKKEKLANNITQESVTQLRKDLLMIINKLRKEKIVWI